MTQSGDSDEWWKQYGGESAPADAGAQQPPPPPAGYSSAPNLHKPADASPQPLQYPNYPPPQANPSGGYAQPNSGGYAQPNSGGFAQPNSGGYAQPNSGGFAQPNSGGFQQPGSGGFAQPTPGAYPPAAPYGQPQGYQPYGFQPAGLGTNGMAIASLIVSVLGLSTLFFCFLPIGSLVGLILGVIALNQVKSSGQDGRGLAQGGIWVGAAGLALGIVLWLIIGAAFIGAGS
ncbi:DUF4190 domain-containing protein [Nocardia sp. NPDC052001]|uniref:DUF4190 domain-containing protein n=1 Tax=Nocardia sp. NPDC052001 TaxID=3154853 RepID=UPI00341C73EE